MLGMGYNWQALAVKPLVDADTGDTEKLLVDLRTAAQPRSKTGASPCTEAAGSWHYCRVLRSGCKTKWADAGTSSQPAQRRNRPVSRGGEEETCSAPLAGAKVSRGQHLAAHWDAMIMSLVKMDSLQKRQVLADRLGRSLRRTKSSRRMIEEGSGGVTCHSRIEGVVNSGGCTMGRPSGLEYAPERWMGAPAFRY